MANKSRKNNQERSNQVKMQRDKVLGQRRARAEQGQRLQGGTAYRQNNKKHRSG